jgi:hypothetical protein
MKVEFDPFERIKQHYQQHREAYVTGIVCFAAGLLCRRPIVVKVINQR